MKPFSAGLPYEPIERRMPPPQGVATRSDFSPPSFGKGSSPPRRSVYVSVCFTGMHVRKPLVRSRPILEDRAATANDL
jgi:hypothetical protein